MMLDPPRHTDIFPQEWPESRKRADADFPEADLRCANSEGIRAVNDSVPLSANPYDNETCPACYHEWRAGYRGRNSMLRRDGSFAATSIYRCPDCHRKYPSNQTDPGICLDCLHLRREAAEKRGKYEKINAVAEQAGLPPVYDMDRLGLVSDPRSSDEGERAMLILAFAVVVAVIVLCIFLLRS
jgi:hypothetical protein